MQVIPSESSEVAISGTRCLLEKQTYVGRYPLEISPLKGITSNYSNGLSPTVTGTQNR